MKIDNKIERLSRKQVNFLLTSADFIKDKHIQYMVIAKILSRLSALNITKRFTKL